VVQLSDYLLLGMTLGLPALLCFAVYVGRCLVRGAKCGMRSKGQRKSEALSPEDGRQMRAGLPAPPTLGFRLWTLDSAAVCRAGAAVLLVGFCLTSHVPENRLALFRGGGHLLIDAGNG
jgi:hypothetical protein